MSFPSFLLSLFVFILGYVALTLTNILPDPLEILGYFLDQSCGNSEFQNYISQSACSAGKLSLALVIAAVSLFGVLLLALEIEKLFNPFRI